MPRQREIVVGRRDHFAIKIAFLPDPDEGRGATPEASLSWGAIEIWVRGHNVCEHIELGEPVSAVHWYLLPVLRWLASNWDFLFHEERLPARNEGRDAWISMLRTSDPPPGLSDGDVDRWELSWHAWWERHCLLACRDGGLFPHLYIRRWRDLIELSWGGRPLPGSPEHFRFNSQHGYARLNADEVAEVLFASLDDTSRHLLAVAPDNRALQEFASDVDRLKTSDHSRRLGLISGFRTDEESAESGWEQVEGLFPDDLPPIVRDAILGATASPLVVRGACPAALMFGSVSPTIDMVDARILAQQLVSLCQPGSESAGLRQYVRDIPLQESEEHAWRQGYDLASAFCEAVGERFSSGGWIDVEKVFLDLGISVADISLKDRTIRAVAIAGEPFRPTVLVNRQYEFLDSETRRFTLAHELCHVLHDRGYRAQIAMASGPWAPVDVEKRANAFAAMFLMPTDLLENVVRRLPGPLADELAIREVASALKTSFSSTLEHLCNLGFVDEITRDSLRYERSL